MRICAKESTHWQNCDRILEDEDVLVVEIVVLVIHNRFQLNTVANVTNARLYTYK